MPQATLKIKTDKKVTAMPDILNSAIYSVTGFLGMQTMLNEFLLCNDYRPKQTGNIFIDSILPLKDLACLESPLYDIRKSQTLAAASS